MKTVSAVWEDRINCFFYVPDSNSDELFLVDTGAKVSVIPPRPGFSMEKSSYTLREANGSQIQTFGQIPMTLNIALKRTFQWFFTVAEVKFPTLGADFLAHYSGYAKPHTHRPNNETYLYSHAK